jgi:DNA primase
MAIKDLVDLIKNASMTQILGNYMRLTKSGSSMKGLCPFHDDKNPSLIVNEQKKLFMCFACQTGGDVITFVQKFKGLDFISALKELCSILGLDFSQFEENCENPKIQLARKILSRTHEIYKKTSPSKEFKEFLKQRNLTQKTCQDFGLGYAGNRRIIANYLQSLPNETTKKQALSVALEIGVIKKGHSYFDTFHNRVIFPIWDHSGNLQGFTTRALLPDQKAKYVNQKGSFIFDKKNLLYGLNLAKEHIISKKSVIICEGNMDVISLHQHNFNNAVAIMGLALGEKALNLLSKMTQQFYLTLDSDAAGKAAAIKINNQLMSLGILPRYVDCSPHKDPDEFLNSLGASKFQELLDQAPIFLDHLIAQALPDRVPEVMDEKLDCLKSIFKLLSPLGDGLEVSERLARLGKKIGLESGPQQILSSYKKFLKAPSLSQRPKKNVLKELPKPSMNPPRQGPSSAEKFLIQELIKHPKYLTHRKIDHLLDLVGQNEVSLLVYRLRSLYYEIPEGEFSKMVISLLQSEELSLPLKELVGMSLYNYRPYKNNENLESKVFKDIELKILEEKLLKEKKELKLKIDNCSDDENLEKLSQELFGIEKKLKNLKFPQENLDHVDP